MYKYHNAILNGCQGAHGHPDSSAGSISSDDNVRESENFKSSLLAGNSGNLSWTFHSFHVFLATEELFIDLGQMIGGARITYSYAIPGGVRNDMPDDFKDRALKVSDYFLRRDSKITKRYFSTTH